VVKFSPTKENGNEPRDGDLVRNTLDSLGDRRIPKHLVSWRRTPAQVRSRRDLSVFPNLVLGYGLLHRDESIVRPHEQQSHE
jgi:hypothetical protein